MTIGSLVKITKSIESQKSNVPIITIVVSYNNIFFYINTEVFFSFRFYNFTDVLPFMLRHKNMTERTDKYKKTKFRSQIRVSFSSEVNRGAAISDLSIDHRVLLRDQVALDE